MRITELLQPCSIGLQTGAENYTDAIHKLTELMAQSGCLKDVAAFEADVLLREQEGSTCMGSGIGIPHAKSKAVVKPGLAALTLPEPGLACDAPGGPVRLMFLIAAPDLAADGAALHVQVLAKLAGLLLDVSFCQELCGATSPEEFLGMIDEREKVQLSDGPLPGNAAPRPAPAPKALPRLLAVTACPAGLAHTYMAAAALRKAAESMKVDIKVETNGASGVQDELTADEIAAADCIIVAADKTVPMERFIGKPVLEVGVGIAVRSPGSLVEKALAGDVPPYEGKLSVIPAQRRLKRLVPDFYRHMMNGISHMLPFVTGGGVLIAISLLLERFGAPDSAYELLETLGRATLNLIYPILSGYLAASIGGLPALMPGLMGGYLATTGMSLAPASAWVPSGFWGALLAGALGGMAVRCLKKWASAIRSDLDHLKSSLLYPVFGLVIVGFAMILLVNPPMGQFNLWMNYMFSHLQGGSRALLAFFMAAMMASDYGGPFNKAAYLSGTLALMGGQYDIMAAVMLGGMVPPIGIALACRVFPDRFTREERRTVPQNLLLGASFVTEGALPFALQDPLRVIPASCLGSGVAGALAILFGCTCPAPHGGLFLLPVLGNPVCFVVSLAVGASVMAMVIGALKKPRPDAEVHYSDDEPPSV